MSLNIPLLLGSCLGLVGCLRHFFDGAHIPAKVKAIARAGDSALTALDAANLCIAWNVVGLLMATLSVCQLYLALSIPRSLPLAHSLGLENKRTILKIFASAWLTHGVLLLGDVGIGEVAPWVCILCAALVGWGAKIKRGVSNHLEIGKWDGTSGLWKGNIE